MTDEFAIKLLEHDQVLPNSENLRKAQEVGANAIRMCKNISSYIDRLANSDLDKTKCLEYLKKYVEYGIMEELEVEDENKFIS